ncbi:hypothetical protein [Leifsonia aquatica]|uniref:hypothetical protein n=1 Tax=Leifsonia aquatica TaxID=144185 RepID=UPI003828AADD
MSDEPDIDVERWVREVVVPGGDEPNRAVVLSVSEEALRQAAGEKASAGDVPFVGVPVASPHVADVLRATQPTRVASAQWIGKVLRVITESGSEYRVDTIAWTLQRMRGRDLQEDPEVAPASRLRRDGDRLHLLRVVDLAEHRRAVFDVEALRQDAVFTRRTTTIVVRIEVVPSGSDEQ